MYSTRVVLFAILSWILGLAGAPCAVRAADEGWPEGCVIAENSQSPDGHYGVLIPSRDAGSGIDDNDKIANKIVDLKTHRQLCVIHNVHYFEGQNHYDLKVTWAPDSSWCAVIYEGRYGFSNITLVEIAGTKCIQSDLGEEIQKSTNAVISRESHKAETGGGGDALFRPGAGRSVLVRGMAQTNPKGFVDQPTYYARFEGTFDLATHKWTRSSAVNSDDSDTWWYTLSDGNEPTEGTDEDKFSWFDNRLNKAYKAVRSVLPAKRFAAVRDEQREWVKQLEAQKSPADKIKFMRPRIEQLRELLW